MSDLTLMLTYSRGTTPQWDGLRTPPGFLLRWFADPFLPFPALGFDIYRAELNYKSVAPPNNTYASGSMLSSHSGNRAIRWRHC